MFDRVGDGSEEGSDFLVADEVEDFLAALFAVEDSRFAELGEMAADDREIDGQAAGDLADGGRTATDGKAGQQGHPIRIAQCLEKRGGNAVFQPIRAAGFEGDVFGGGGRDGDLLAHLRNYAIIFGEVKRIQKTIFKLFCGVARRTCWPGLKFR